MVFNSKAINWRILKRKPQHDNFPCENMPIYQTQILFTEQIQNNTLISFCKKEYSKKKKSITKWGGCQNQMQNARK